MGQREADSGGIEIRKAETGDAVGIRNVALESLNASYTDVLDEEVIETAVESWYADEAMEAELREEGMLYLVAVAGDEVLGFSQNLLSEAGGTGTVLWLHVEPDNRDRNIGTTLLNQTLATLSERGDTLARIANRCGAEREQVQRGELGGEGLGGRDADFRTGPDV